MIIVYFSNFLNHHQKIVADILSKTDGIEYIFVEVVPMYNWLKEGGYTDYSHESYVLRAWENDANMEKAKYLAKSADVALFGGHEVLFLEVIRAKYTNKLSFDVSERWLKRGVLNLLSPRLLKSHWYYHTLFRYKNFYKLCASAFAATDEYKLHSYIDRCYKWGYFTQVDEDFNVDESPKKSYDSGIISIMWCSRFLKWKHPELPIMMAKNLKLKGYKFTLDMYGTGEYLEQSKKLVERMHLSDVINFCGNVPNLNILEMMRQHDIFLFTSDQNEGWGAVANESMSNGCVIVGSDTIGAAPFLIKDGENGFLFRSASPSSGFSKNAMKIDNSALDSLCDKVEWLIKNPIERNILATRAYETMKNVWSPKIAANNLLQLINDLQSGRDTSIKNGPCSKALPL